MKGIGKFGAPFSEKGKSFRWFSGFAFAILLSWTTGCETVREHTLTGKLWSGEDPRRFSDPAPEPRVRLSESRARHDVLVEYDAITGRDDHIERRAYFLNENRARLENHRKPAFVSKTAMRDLDLVSIAEGVSATGTDETNRLYYTVIDSDHAFCLFAPQQASRQSRLPVYPEASGRWKTIALTPLTFAGDCTIVGAILGTVVWTGLAGFFP